MFIYSWTHCNLNFGYYQSFKVEIFYNVFSKVSHELLLTMVSAATSQKIGHLCIPTTIKGTGYYYLYNVIQRTFHWSLFLLVMFIALRLFYRHYILSCDIVRKLTNKVEENKRYIVDNKMYVLINVSLSKKQIVTTSCMIN